LLVVPDTYLNEARSVRHVLVDPLGNRGHLHTGSAEPLVEVRYAVLALNKSVKGDRVDPMDDATKTLLKVKDCTQGRVTFGGGDEVDTEFVRASAD